MHNAKKYIINIKEKADKVYKTRKQCYSIQKIRYNRHNETKNHLLLYPLGEYIHTN